MTKAHASHPTSIGLPAFFAPLLARFAAAVRAAARRHESRKTYRRLLEAEEILRDVGLTRQDILQALRE